jgi:hypothetical protein
MPELSAQELALHKVFSSDYDFLIPEYQRPYAWDVEQAQELLSDLVEASDRSSSDPYFLGSLVLVKDTQNPRADVIDGQQRLTTLTILLSLLRDLTEDDQVQASLGMFVQQPADVVLGLAAKPRLTLRPRDRDFFARYVQAVGSTRELLTLGPHTLTNDSQRAIQANAQAMSSMLIAWSESERLALIQMLAKRTYLVAVSTPDLDSAHRVFGVMNARGLDLSPADIFKSKVIGALREQGGDAEIYAAKREDAEELIGRDDFADLFLHIRLIAAKQRGRQGLLKEFPEQVLNQYLPDHGDRFVDKMLVPYAKAYEQIRDRSYSSISGAEQVNAWFGRLAQLDNNDWRAPALWALRKKPNDPLWLDQFLRKVERLAASMFLRREWTTPRVSRYIELLRQLDGGAYGLDAPAFELTDLEREETLRVIDGDVYLSTKTRKYVLLRLDETLANGSGVTYDHPIVTVEHVLPQSPRDSSQWRVDFSDAERERWTHRLANLVLLNRVKNSEAQNYDFSLKKEKYFSGKKGVTTFALTSQVLQQPEWSVSILESRQAALLRVLAREWNLQ